MVQKKPLKTRHLCCLAANESHALVLRARRHAFLTRWELTLVDLHQGTKKSARRLQLKWGNQAEHEQGKGFLTFLDMVDQAGCTIHIKQSLQAFYGHVYDFEGKHHPLLFDIQVLTSPGKARLQAEGRLLLGKREYIFAPATSFAWLQTREGKDRAHGPGVSAYACGFTSGREICLHLEQGDGHVPGTINSKLMIDGEELGSWDIRLASLEEHIAGSQRKSWLLQEDTGRIQLTFEPKAGQCLQANHLPKRKEGQPCFGHFVGRIQAANQTIKCRLFGFLMVEDH